MKDDVRLSPVVDPPHGLRAKRLGAYYTDQRIADFLVGWAVRAAAETVLDPSFGGGVFLEAALKRLERLGGNSPSQVYGVEIDERVHGQIAYELSLLYRVETGNFLHADFFQITPKTLRAVDAVVGNPPFIRYQSFNGADRQLALRQAEQQGVALNKLVSSWAPFLVHSCSLLKQGGRLAMVVPVEIGHAAYARPVLKYLVENFGRTILLTFKERLFPDLSQDTLLLLAEDKWAENRGNPTGNLFLADLRSVADLTHTSTAANLTSAAEIDVEAIVSGRTTLTSYWISEEARNLYEKLSKSEIAKRLGDFAEVGIGYVTGSNGFFHLGKAEAKKQNITPAYLTPAVYRSRALGGLRFSRRDWSEAEKVGEAGYLLDLSGKKRLSKSVKAYLEKGETQGVAKAYKCRVRSPWYAVPHVYRPDAFLTYMSGLRPQLVANHAGAVTPNSLHAVRLRHGTSLSAHDLALPWQTSLTSLSVELEGHALGGGMLKLEPSEAKNVLIANPGKTETFRGAFDEVDSLLRQGREQTARELADTLILENLLGLSSRDVRVLREAAQLLRNRRYYKGKRPGEQVFI